MTVTARTGFRGRVREAALDHAYAVSVAQGWSAVTLVEVAAAVGVSRPTLYAEFGSKEGLGQALVLRQTERFLGGVTGVLAEHAADPVAGIAAAVRFSLERAGADPLLRAVLTASHGGSDDLLRLLTTASEPLVSAADATLRAWFATHHPALPAAAVAEVVDAVVRLTISHLLASGGPPTAVARQVARLAAGYLGLPPGDTRPATPDRRDPTGETRKTPSGAQVAEAT